MASQVNSQFAYINLINGETIWERLRIVRNFIEDRKIAKKLQTTQDKKRLGFLAKIDEAKLSSEKIFAEVELEEFDAHKEQQEDGYKKLDDELEFLLKYEMELAKIAEETRVLDKTDDEMYQINMGTEVIMRNMRKIETERVASMIGCSLATAEESMRVPEMRYRMINTASALSLPNTEETAQIRIELMQNGLDFNNIPLSVQEELKLNQILLLGK
jgi:transcription elongation GreA/GreB family factor